MRRDIRNGDAKWQGNHEIAKQEKIYIILNVKKFEIPCKLNCKQPLILKDVK